MASSSEYVPPKVWTWNKPNGGRFANINRPTAGPTHDKDLPVGRHPLQLYSLGTPNGGRVASEDYSSEAPTDPDMRVFRIRLFGSRFRYATIAGRMWGSGSG